VEIMPPKMEDVLFLIDEWLRQRIVSPEQVREIIRNHENPPKKTPEGGRGPRH
jgi:hypothetical protein